MESQTFFRGLFFGTFVLLVCLSCLCPPPQKKNQKASGMLHKHSRGNTSDPKCCSPQCQTTTLWEVLQEHPDLSSTFFYSQLGCVLRAPLVQTPHLSHRALRNGGRRGPPWSRTSLSDALCIWVGVFYRRRRSGAPTKQRSRAWNHLSSALKGLHRFLMISPYLYIYTQRLHSF